VPVQRFDDPVAPAPDMRLAVTDLAAVAPAGPVAVTPDVHPVAAPALAVLRTLEKAIDDLLVSFRVAITEKGVQFLGCRRQADQIEVDAAQKDGAARLRPGFQAVPFVEGGNERVDGITHPARVLDRWH